MTSRRFEQVKEGRYTQVSRGCRTSRVIGDASRRLTFLSLSGWLKSWIVESKQVKIKVEEKKAVTILKPGSFANLFLLTFEFP